jgi:hypothetical protein
LLPIVGDSRSGDTNECLMSPRPSAPAQLSAAQRQVADGSRYGIAVTGVWETVLAVAAVGVSVASAVVAVLARRDSRRAAKAAEDTIALERERRQEELAPLWSASSELHRLGSGFTARSKGRPWRCEGDRPNAHSAKL